MISSGTQLHLPEKLFHQFLGIHLHSAKVFYFTSGHLGIEEDSAVLKPSSLTLPGFFYTLPDLCGRFTAVVRFHIRISHRRRFPTDIHAIQKRTADPSHIAPYFLFAATAAAAIRIVTTAAGVHGRTQHDIRRKAIARRDSRDHNHSILQRLTQRLQRRP